MQMHQWTCTFYDQYWKVIIDNIIMVIAFNIIINIIITIIIILIDFIHIKTFSVIRAVML